MTLVGGLLFSLHIAYLGMKSGQKDPVLLTIVQFLFAGLWGAEICVFTETSVLSTGRSDRQEAWPIW